jgi:hypothetical protein
MSVRFYQRSETVVFPRINRPLSSPSKPALSESASRFELAWNRVCFRTTQRVPGTAICAGIGDLSLQSVPERTVDLVGAIRIIQPHKVLYCDEATREVSWPRCPSPAGLTLGKCHDFNGCSYPLGDADAQRTHRTGAQRYR